MKNKKFYSLTIIFLALIVAISLSFSTPVSAHTNVCNGIFYEGSRYNLFTTEHYDPNIGVNSIGEPCPDNDKDGAPACLTNAYCTVICTNGIFNSGYCSGSTSSPNATYPDCNDLDPETAPNKLRKKIENITLDFNINYRTDALKNKHYFPMAPYNIYDTLDFNLKWGKDKACGFLWDLSQTNYSFIIGNESFKIPFDAFVFTNESKLTLNYPSELNESEQERFIQTLGNKVSQVTFRMEFKGSVAETQIPMTNCRQLYGSGRHNLVAMRGKSSSITGERLSNLFNAVREDGFELIEPFEKYNASFSFFSDLFNYDDYKFTTKDKIYFSDDADEFIIKTSSCNAGEKYFFYTGREEMYSAYTAPKGKVIHLNLNQSRVLYNIAVVSMHEFGHAFCGLYDEYNYTEKIKLSAILNNCVIDPTHLAQGYVNNNIFYGDKNTTGCTFDNYFRPSNNSIMRFHFSENRFNVISCGYCLKEINGGTAKSHWQECMALDTIKPAV